ncbi:MAG TPA: hypothetical protein VM146_14895 [Steroidobacteraceae bacterium]|nr:hypothetical protein [Steroidobacteraceae bacterium]
MRPVTLVCLLLFFASVAAAADHGFTGYARDAAGELLYLETHEVHAAGTVDEFREVLYRRDAQSEPFARKTLRYGADRQRPSFMFVDQRSGVTESVEHEGTGFRIASRAGRDAPLRIGTLKVSEVAVVDAGFDEFVLARWSQLQRGQSLDVPFLVPSRLGALDFRVRKVKDTRVDDAAASVIRISLAGPLGWLLPDIEVTYRDRDQRLLRYRGLTNIRDARGSLLSAQIDFPDAEVVGR